MKISDKKRMDVYAAIADPLLELRLAIQRNGPPSKDVLDQMLFNMTSDIWRRVHKALNLEGPP